MTQVIEPAMTSPTETDWQYELANRARGRMNYISIDIDLTNLVLKAGSQAVVGGALYVAKNDEKFSDALSDSNYDNYLVFTPDENDGGELAILKYVTLTWDAARGGYYSGPARALAKIRQYNGNRSFVTLARKEDINVDYPIPTFTGNGVNMSNDDGTPDTPAYMVLPAGVYTVELKGGSGGNGGNNGFGFGGGVGAAGEVVSIPFFTLVVDTKVTCIRGGNGENGGDGRGEEGVAGSGVAGGGGGASGRSSLFFCNGVLYEARGGSGGGGGGEWGGGGGGAGAYGVAQDGAGAVPGKGGANDVGGNGGNRRDSSTGGGGGGGGFLSAGSGGSGGGGAGSGIHGGNGSSTGGAGGDGVDKRNSFLMVTRYFDSSCGGGGGGGDSGKKGGDGGLRTFGIASPSDGYVRVYKHW